MDEKTAGRTFRAALKLEQPLQIIGVPTAYTAILAKNSGFRALYLSGAGVSNSAFALPDLALTTFDNVLEEARRITSACDLPLLIDIDTGWGSPLMISRVIREFIKSGAAAVHIEDQISLKRCGHRRGKVLVSIDEMCGRISAAVDARSDPDFVIMARTDAYTVDGLSAAIDRACRYEEAGADMHFAEAFPDLESYRLFTTAVKRPVLANMTEFGKTPLFSTEELREVGISLVLYPLSLFRIMNASAKKLLMAIRQEGSQKAFLSMMETRDELDSTLHYREYESKIDVLTEKYREQKETDDCNHK